MNRLGLLVCVPLISVACSLSVLFLADGATSAAGSNTTSDCSACGDVNGDGQIDIGDPTYLLQFLFGMGQAPDCHAASPGLSPTEIALLADVLPHLSITYEDDGAGGTVKTLRFSGVNVQVVNGLGSTDTINGAGNLIVGYNELGNTAGDFRTGSHTLVGGMRASYSSYGGIVAGSENTVTAPFAAAAAGTGNQAVAEGATVSGGAGNTASGINSAISGGFSGVASNTFSSVSGGRFNSAEGIFSSVLGGLSNRATGFFSTVLGGEANESVGLASCVSGGESNTSNGIGSTVSGGLGATTTTDHGWAAGSIPCQFSCP